MSYTETVKYYSEIYLFDLNSESGADLGFLQKDSGTEAHFVKANPR